MKLFSGSSNKPLAEKISQELKVNLSKIEVGKFDNGESRIWVEEDVINQNCVVIQSFSTPCDQMIMEFLLIVDALVRAGAEKIFAIVPWMAYSLQDKVFRTGEPVAAKVVGSLISHCGVNRIFTIDLHSTSVVGFFGVPVMHYSAAKLFSDYVKQNINNNSIVVAPDYGALKRSRVFAKELDLQLVSIDKERDKVSGDVSLHSISGSVSGKTCLIFDDLINTGRTVAATAKFLKEDGAQKVYFFSTHNLYLDAARIALESSPVDKVVVTDSIKPEDIDSWTKLDIVSLAPLFASGINKWL